MTKLTDYTPSLSPETPIPTPNQESDMMICPGKGCGKTIPKFLALCWNCGYYFKGGELK